MELDDAQRRATAHTAGPLCVLGGPGTGKTTVLEERFIRLARSEGSSADRILWLVPNRAQKIALVERLTHRLLFEAGLDAVIDVPVYTWYGLANHLVSRHYDKLGYAEPPVLLTAPEQWGDIRDALAAESKTNWPHHKHLLENRGFVDEIVDFSIRAKQRFLGEEDLRRLEAARPQWAEIIRFYRAHGRRLQTRARVDYPTLLADAAWLIANHDDVRLALQSRFTHIMVDDAQEMSKVQQRLLNFLAGLPDPYEQMRSLVVAADPDSAIETFRGAEPNWLGDFRTTYRGADTISLPVSYRIGPQLGDRVHQFMEATGPATHRPQRWAGNSTVDIRRFANLAAEMDAVARELRLAHLRDGTPYEDMAILLTSPQSMLPALERALGAVAVPFSISAPDRPLEREPVVRTFCLLARHALRGEVSVEDADELLRSPLVGLDDADVRALARRARMEGKELTAVMQEAPSENGRVAEALGVLADLRSLLRDVAERPADQAFWAIWDRAPYLRTLEADARSSLAHPANRDLDALVAFARSLGRFVERRRGTGTLLEYLDSIGRADFGSDSWLPPERGRGGVNVLSFHGAKGKEWSLVAVCGCVEGLIPKGRRARGLFDPFLVDETSAVERARRNDAEDRRVFHVAVTRSRGRCLVTTSAGPSRRGQPSRFVDELNGAPLDVAPAADLPPLTFAEATGRLKRVLVDIAAPKADRVAALAAIARICELDPTCASARPSEWWWRWDWTAGMIPIRDRHSGTDDLPPDKIRTSYSRISQYDNCGLAYLLSVVLGLDPETSHNMAFGTWIHKIFEEIEGGALTNRPAVAARYEELFDEAVFPNVVVARQFRRDGEAILKRYIDMLKPGTALMAEHKFNIDFNGHRITGRIDRVDRIGKGLVVSDYKTSRYPIYWDDARKSLQLAIYYLAAKWDETISAHGEPISMQLVYPAKLARNEVAKRCQTPEEAEVALERLPALIDGVLREDFRPSPEADCMWCKFKPLCPLWPEGKELPA
jgi:superfamily I DNA/RNA helicase/RecB family exonuclease